MASRIVALDHDHSNTWSTVPRFKAQSDAITWAKEGLMSELRKELRVSDEEHRELLGKVNADDVLKQIREWRQAGANQTGFIANVVSAPGPTPSPTVSASQKKQKTANVMPSLHLQPPPSNLRHSPVPSPPLPFSATMKQGDHVGVRGRKPKVGQSQTKVPPIVRAPQIPPAVGPQASGREQIVQKRPPGRPPGKSRPSAVASVDPLIGRKVATRWPQDNHFYEAVITDYNSENGTHALVYDINTHSETWEWVNLKEEHEQSLLEAIERLAEASDGESEDGRHPPSSRTHSIERERVRSRQDSGNEPAFGDDYDTAEDGRGEGSYGEPFVGEGGVASDDMQDGDDGDEYG